MKNQKLPVKVVIVGGGFGGIRSALKLANNSHYSVRLISDKNYFEYHAALYRSATGRSLLEVAIPLNDFFAYAKNVEVVSDKITTIDADNKRVIGESESHYTYDKLILAVGSVTQYFGIHGIDKYAYGVKSIHEALKLKRHLHDVILSGGQPEKNYVIIGAGATGVELSAEMRFYIKKIRKNHKIKQKNYNIDLIEGAPNILPSLPTSFTDKIDKRLKRIGVKVYKNTKIQAETFDNLKLPNGDIRTHSVVWTAGVANNPLVGLNSELLKTDPRGKVIVNEYLEAADDICVIGDSASTKYSGMAQSAIHDANFVVKNMIRLDKGKKKYKYKPAKPIYAVPVGPHYSAVLWGNFKLYGLLGWVFRRCADLQLYLRFLPIHKAVLVWRSGFVSEESCPVCKS